MRFQIKSETLGRIRIHFNQKKLSFEEADRLEYFVGTLARVSKVKIYERTADAVILYTGDRREILRAIRSYEYDAVEVPAEVLENSGRELNSRYQEKMVVRTLVHYGKRLVLPLPVRTVLTAVQAIPYIKRGLQTLLQGKLEVPVLDGLAIGVSVARGDINTASSVMFLLGIGELLEEWTHKKSVGDLARSMSLNVSSVWMVCDEQEVLVPVSQIHAGDTIVVHMGNVIPFDGTVVRGEGMVNQASLTGESQPVRKAEGLTCYAGTVLEEGELTILVTQTNGSSKYEQIVTMIEESEKLKSSLESKAEHLADSLVPYTLGGTALVYLLTRNVTKTLAVLMVDFSCALKLAMPISVLSAIREASEHQVTVKGGKFLEAIAEADTIVFDKTGTLTKAKPTVAKVVPFGGKDAGEMLRMAACMEEHFPHSMAKAVVEAAREQHLEHEEMHSKVEYIVAHGIATTVDEKRTCIGSYHFIFEDEKCHVPSGEEEKFAALPGEYSHLYLAVEDELVAVICIEDPLRAEAKEVLRELKEAGISKLVMMTGDSERTAASIAARVGVDEYYSEVLPEDKAGFIEREKAAGRKVIMVGDGINDSPALSAADVGIAISDGAELAREIADITVAADSLRELVTLKKISNALMQRIRWNYRTIVAFNTGLIGLGVMSVIQPTTSALLHNASTLAIGVKSMGNLLEKDDKN